MFVIIAKKNDRGLCCAYKCRNKKPMKDKFCPKHRKRFDRINRPLEYTFNLLKSNAKRRKKPFDLTIDEFKKFCAETNYLERKGKLKSSLTIDRIRSDRGYSYNNIQVLTLSENSRKQNSDIQYPF